jgi:hypothetical protein
MRDITITRQVFTTYELSPAARETAINKLREIAYETLPSRMVAESMNGELYGILTGNYLGDIGDNKLAKDIGLSIEWSLSYCQGDGVAIYGTLDSGDATGLNWGDATKAILTRNHWGNHYTHGNCIDIALYRYDDQGYEIDITDTDYFADQIKDICRKLERHGYAEIENFTSETTVIDMLNDCYADTARRFNDDGTFAPQEFWAAQ